MGCEREVGTGGLEEVGPDAFMERLVELHGMISKLECLKPSKTVNLLFTELVRLCIRPCRWGECQGQAQLRDLFISYSLHQDDEAHVQNSQNNHSGGVISNGIITNHHHHHEEEVVNLISRWIKNGINSNHHGEVMVNHISGEVNNGISANHHHDEEMANSISGGVENGISGNHHEEEEVVLSHNSGGLTNGIGANHHEEELAKLISGGGIKNGNGANHHEEEVISLVNGGVKNGISANHLDEEVVVVNHHIIGEVKNGISANHYDEEAVVVNHHISGEGKNGISANQHEEEDVLNHISVGVKNGICARHHDEGKEERIVRKVMEIRTDLIQLCGKAEGLLESHYSFLIGNLPDPHTQFHLFPYYSNYRKLAFLEYKLLMEYGGLGGQELKLAFVGSGPLPLTSLVLALHHLSPSAYVDNYDMDEEANILARRLLSGHPDLASRMGFHSCNIKKVKEPLWEYGVVFLAALVGMDANSKGEVIEHLGLHMAPGATLVARSAHGSRAFLYPVIEPAMLSPWFEIRSIFHPQDDILNSVIIARKKRPLLHPL